MGKFLAAFFLLGIALASIFVPVIGDPYNQDISSILVGPNSSFWFGTDSLGRDLWARSFSAARVSLLVCFCVSVLSFGIGLFIGGTAGLLGGKFDRALMRITDMFYCLPPLVIAMLIMLVIGSNVVAIIVSLSLVGWIKEAKVTRSLVFQIRSQTYIDSAIALGLPRSAIFFTHILPNVLRPVLMATLVSIPEVILAESFLSFLGIGLTLPDASWGTLIREGWQGYQQYPHLIVCPGLLLVGTVFSLVILSTQNHRSASR